MSGEEELRQRLLKLRLEALVSSGEEKAADQAMETLTQVMHMQLMLKSTCSSRGSYCLLCIVY